MLFMHVWQVTGLKSSTSGSLAAFERLEQKVVAMEAEADAVGQVWQKSSVLMHICVVHKRSGMLKVLCFGACI